jgi:ferredoxin like protein
MMDEPFTWKGTLIRPASSSHIALKDETACRECPEKPCTFICPSGVYRWRDTDEQLEIRPRRCLECGASLLLCPKDNITWGYPPGGLGVEHRH